MKRAASEGRLGGRRILIAGALLIALIGLLVLMGGAAYIWFSGGSGR